MTERIEINIEEGLILRQLHNHDAANLFEVIKENQAYLRKFLNWADAIHNEAQALHMIQQYEQDTINEKGITFGIWKNSALIGSCMIYDWNKILKKASVGYWIAQHASKNGIATQCTHTLTQYAFEYLSVEKVELYILPNNTGSLRVAEKCGFRIEGLLSHWYHIHGQPQSQYVAGLLKSTWKSN